MQVLGGQARAHFLPYRPAEASYFQTYFQVSSLEAVFPNRTQHIEKLVTLLPDLLFKDWVKIKFWLPEALVPLGEKSYTPGMEIIQKVLEAPQSPGAFLAVFSQAESHQPAQPTQFSRDAPITRFPWISVLKYLFACT